METYDDFVDDSNDSYAYEDYADVNQECLKMQKDVIQFGAIPTSVFFSVVVVLSLFGNVLVLVILVKFENMKSVTNTLILNLAVSDLMFTAGLPFWAHYHLHGWTFGDPACKIVNWMFYCGFYSSTILLVLMTMHRYIAVMSPLSNIVSAAGFSSMAVTAVIWIISTLLASPNFIFVQVHSGSSNNSLYCKHTDPKWRLWTIYQQNALFLVCSLVFVFCYSQIIFRLMCNSIQRRKSRTLKLIFILVVGFFIGWGPYNYFSLMLSFTVLNPPKSETDADKLKSCRYNSFLNKAFYICRLLAFSHCCFNPVFYVLVGIKFKNHLKRMLKGCHRNKNIIRSRQSRLTITSVTSGEELSMQLVSG